VFVTFIGPTTVRDGLGEIADTLTDPFTWSRFYHRWTVIDARAILGGLDQRNEASGQLAAIDNMSTDSYATLRSLYLQNRAVEIATPPGGSPPLTDLNALPDFGPAPGAAPPADAAPPAAAPPGGDSGAIGPALPPDAKPDAPPPAPGAKPVDAKPVAANVENPNLVSRRSDAKLLAALSEASAPTL
jgi:phospholipid-binding lipoprotein MlaA